MDIRCLSVKQPWASLIASGRKTLEIRTWRTDYRGALVICSSAKASPMIATYGDGPRGCALCVVELVAIRPARPALDVRHAIVRPDPTDFAWVLSDPRALPHFPMKGQLSLFRPSRDLLDHLEAAGILVKSGAHVFE